MYETQPAVIELNKVPGFDPRRFLRKTVAERTNHEILYLDLKYKKLWFRLKYPKGRIEKIRLKVTEQIAIIEARVFLDKDDAQPVSSFIAQRNANGRPGALYIEAAQNAAENQALIDAGFGLQFCDVSQGPDTEPLDAGIPIRAAAADIRDTAQEDVVRQAAIAETVALTKQTATPSAAAALKETSPEKTADRTVEAASVPSAQEISKSTPSQSNGSNVPDTAANAAQSPARAVLETVKDRQQNAAPACGGEQLRDNTPEAPQASRYTADMSVDEICALMTPADAVAIVVDTGTCKGWALADVLEKRPASLKWYLNGYTGNNNILKAGARLLLEMYAEKKAS
jgi:hypothetical protein